MFNPAGGQTYNLNASIGSTDTSITLASFLEPVSNTPYTMALLNTDIVYATIAPRTSSSEFISFTGITQNSDGTATLTGVTRGLAKKYPYTTNVTFKLPHAGQSQFILSDAPQVFNQYAGISNDNTYTGTNSFTAVPNSPSAPISNNDLTNKAYVDALVNGGAVSTNQQVVAGIAGETIVAGNSIYLKESDGRWWKTDADDPTTINNVQLGIAMGAGTAGNSISSGVLRTGTFATTGLIANTKYYFGNTAGALSTTPGTVEVTAGYATSTTSIYFYPRYDQQLTEDEQDALQGTSGTPSNTNRFVTNNDTSTTTGASKVVRAGSDGKIDAGFIKTSKKLYVSPTEVTFTNGNGGAGAGVEQTLFSTTIPANSLGTDNAFRYKIYISGMGSNTASSSYTFRVKFGGSTQLTLTNGSSGNALTNLGGYLEGYIIADGSTSAQKVTGAGMFTTNASEGSADANVGVSKMFINGTSTSSIDSTSNQTFAISLQQTNNADNDCVVEWCVIELIA